MVLKMTSNTGIITWSSWFQLYTGLFHVIETRRNPNQIDREYEILSEGQLFHTKCRTFIAEKGVDVDCNTTTEHPSWFGNELEKINRAIAYEDVRRTLEGANYGISFKKI